MNPVIFFTTVESKKRAKSIGNHLVKNGFAACVNIISNIESIYHWKDQLQQDTEFLLMIKSDASKKENIQKIMNDFVAETKSELWNSEKELLNYYKKEENYLKLKKGQVGGNLIYKYKSMNLVGAVSDWVNYFGEQLFKAIKEKHINISSIENIKLEISEIASFCKLKI